MVVVMVVGNGQLHVSPHASVSEHCTILFSSLFFLFFTFPSPPFPSLIFFSRFLFFSFLFFSFLFPFVFSLLVLFFSLSSLVLFRIPRTFHQSLGEGK